MTIAQRTVGQSVPAYVQTAAVRTPGALAAKRLASLGKLLYGVIMLPALFFAGASGGYRSYPREGYPEHELHQIVAGRKDRFDGLM
jgi:hypothetical protein